MDRSPMQVSNYDTQPMTHLQLSPTGYTGILVSVVSLYVVCSGIIAYLVWDRLARRKGKRLQENERNDLEQGGIVYKKREQLFTPGTAVAQASPKFETVHLSPAPSSPRSQSSREKQDYEFPLPPKVTNEPGSPSTISSMSPSQGSHCAAEMPSDAGLSIGDRLRNLLMVRESAGNLPDSAELHVAATTLGVNLNGSHSRSSLFTIPEVSTEASPLGSPEITPSPGGLMTNSSRTASSC